MPIDWGGTNHHYDTIGDDGEAVRRIGLAARRLFPPAESRVRTVDLAECEASLGVTRKKERDSSCGDAVVRDSVSRLSALHRPVALFA